MRIMEGLFLAGLLASFLGAPLIKKAAWRIGLATLPVVLAAAAILTEGWRFAMAPAYLLAAVLFVFQRMRQFIRAKRKHPVLRIIGTAALCLAFALSAALPLLFPVRDLPRPGGADPVGTVRMDFSHPARMDLLSGEPSPQDIAVQVWYPARGTAGKERARWMDSRKVAGLFAQGQMLPDLFGQLCMVRTNSYWGAPLSDGAQKYPVVLFSGGAGSFNGQNVIQMEELASRGYVVFAVSHPYDDFAVLHADGSIVPFRPGQFEALVKDSAGAAAQAQKQAANEGSPDFYQALIRGSTLNARNVRIWSDDMIFAADQIRKLDEDGASPFAGRLDTDNMGLMGHSFGGAAVGQACLADSRFKGFINLDGTPFGETVDRAVVQPFMLLAADPPQAAIDSGYAKVQGNYISVKIKGAQHMDFSDLNLLLSNPGRAVGLLGPIGPQRQAEIVNSYIVSFFDACLKGGASSVTDVSLAAYPEAAVKVVGSAP